MKPKEQLRKLVKLQKLADEIRAAEQLSAEAPGKIEAIEEAFRERNAEYVAIRDRHDELEADQRMRSGAVEDLEERRKKFMDDLMSVKNQKEYAAMLKEIDAVKAQLAENEDVILRDMEEIEKLQGELKTQEEHISAEREQVAKQRAEVEAATKEADATAAKLQAERAGIEAELPDGVAEQARRVEQGRAGTFVAAIEGGACTACFVRVRPQVHQEIRSGRTVHRCGSCGRFLYVPRDVAPDKDGEKPADKKAAPPPQAPSGDAEASTGGTV